MSIDVVSQHFSCIEDTRQQSKVNYTLFDVLFLTVSAVISGGEGWEDIEDFAYSKRESLTSKGLFEKGIPVHDTIARIIARIEPVLFRQCFCDWMKCIAQLNEGEVIAIDGKTLRGSYKRDDRKSTIHMVNAFATANGVALGQCKTDTKSNEITAIPELLSLLEIKGCLVSIDAMGCQTDIAQTILDKGADYLLAVKGNQPSLYEAVKKALSPHISAKSTQPMSIEHAHGRHEIREYHVIAADILSNDFAQWSEMKSLGVAVSFRYQKGKTPTLDYRYYISSRKLDTKVFGQAVRSHWGIENSLHWVLDVSMSEDACQIYRGNAPEILASTRQLGLNMLKIRNV